jgi:hypothetical protein
MKIHTITVLKFLSVKSNKSPLFQADSFACLYFCRNHIELCFWHDFRFLLTTVVFSVLVLNLVSTHAKHALSPLGHNPHWICAFCWQIIVTLDIWFFCEHFIHHLFICLFICLLIYFGGPDAWTQVFAQGRLIFYWLRLVSRCFCPCILR